MLNHVFDAPPTPQTDSSESERLTNTKKKHTHNILFNSTAAAVVVYVVVVESRLALEISMWIFRRVCIFFLCFLSLTLARLALAHF